MKALRFSVPLSLLLASCVSACAQTNAPASTPRPATPPAQSNRSDTPPASEDLHARLLRAIDDIQRGYDSAGEGHIAAELRSVVGRGDGDHAAAAMAALKIMQHRMRAVFAISDQDVEAADHSIGVYMLSHGPDKAALPVLLREARFLSSGAQRALDHIYEHGSAEIAPYDASILEFYKESAREGIRPSELALGKAALYGWGIVPDHELAVALLEDSELPAAYLILADDARSRGDGASARRYLEAKKKVEAGNAPPAKP